MADIDYSALFSDDPGAAQGQAMALARAIAQRRAAGQLGLVTGDTQGIGALGKELTGDADKMEQTLVGAAQHRAQQQMLRQHYAAQAAQMADLMRHRQVLEGQGQDRLDQGAARLAAYERAMALRGIRYNPNTGQFEDVSPKHRGGGPVFPGVSGALDAPPAPTPTPTPGSPAPTPAGAGGARYPRLEGKILDKALKDLGADFDPTGGRAGEFGKNYARVGAARRVFAVASDTGDENGNARNLTVKQMPELAQAVASLIAAGGTGTQAQIEHLLPKSLKGNLAGLEEFLTSAPQGADQVEFVKQFLETAKREKDVAQKLIDEARNMRAGKHQRVLRGNPEESKTLLERFGWTLGPDGLPAMKSAAPAAAATAPPGALPPGKARFKNKTTGKTAIGPKGAAPEGWEEVP